MNCLNCQQETKNPKYCCRSCSATVTGRLFPKRKIQKKCIKCENTVKSYRHNRCEFHWQEYKESKYQNRTIGEYRNLVSVKHSHPSWIHAHIRNFARSWLKHLTKLPCKFCGYDKHVELAHIKAICDFEDDALLSEVNSPENVIQLCRNCHWEFDNLPRKYDLNKN